MPLTGGLRVTIEEISGKIQAATPLTGGDISTLYRLDTQQGQFVVKTHAAAPPGFFGSEEAGLRALGKAGLDVPQVLGWGDNFLLMEYLTPGEAKPAIAGESLAQLHSLAAPEYGYNQSTYLATLLQNNRPGANAADFYFRQRLEPLTAGRESGLWQNFFEKTAALLNSCPAPALLHGDLWSGNLYHAARGPVFIDPAVYWGDPLTDIAMTKLFGGFDPEFYEAYFSVRPRREHQEELLWIFQIYPLLVHAHLFSAGGYYTSAAAIRDRFIR